MRAIILVGGKATRLLPLTDNRPKAVLPVLNTPFLEYVIRHLSRHGIKDIILAQGHLAQPIEEYLGDGSRFGVKLTYVVEETPRGTAGALKNAEALLDSTFLVVNGDIFTDLDISAMISHHREKKAKATIALTPVADPTSYGMIETDTVGRVRRFIEKPKHSEITTNMINAGTYILEPEVLSKIPPRTTVSIERETFPQLIAGGEPVYAYSSSAYWLDIGTPEKYIKLNCDLLNGKCQHHGFASGKEVIIGEQSDIHPTAQIQGPALIGNRCTIARQAKIRGPAVIGDGCTILKDSIIENSIIWRKVRLGARASLKNSIVADKCCLDEGSCVEDSVLGDKVTVAAGCQLRGSKVCSGTVVKNA